MEELHDEAINLEPTHISACHTDRRIVATPNPRSTCSIYVVASQFLKAPLIMTRLRGFYIFLVVRVKTSSATVTRAWIVQQGLEKLTVEATQTSPDFSAYQSSACQFPPVVFRLTYSEIAVGEFTGGIVQYQRLSGQPCHK